jgi:hypothetical protein
MAVKVELRCNELFIEIDLEWGDIGSGYRKSTRDIPSGKG